MVSAGRFVGVIGNKLPESADTHSAMDFDALAKFLHGLTFRQAVWLFPGAFSEGLLTAKPSWISFAVAGIVHALDVSHNVFKVW